MQSLGSIAYADLDLSGQEILTRLEVYDGATWWDLSNLHEALIDGGLEDWASATNLTSWIEGEVGTSTVNRDAADVHGGLYSARLDISAGNDYAAVQQADIPLKRPLNYCLSGWYKTAAGKTAQIIMMNSGVADVYMTATGTWTTDVTLIPLAAATAWTRFAFYFTPHPSYVLYNVAFLRDSAASSSIWFDDLSIAAWPSNFLVDKSLAFSTGGAGVSPDPIAATWSAEISNDDGIFHPRHPTSEFSTLLQVGRKVRISVGGMYGGNEHIPQTGLVGYWSFDEASGTVAYDHSSYGSNGTLTNMDAADWVPGKSGTALDFDGSDDYVEVADAAHLDITAAITISAWVQPASIPAWAVILTKGTSATWNNNNYTLGLQAGRIDFRWSAVGTCLVDAGDALVAGVWAHVLVTVAPGTTGAVKVYINGVLKKTTDRSGDPTPNAQALRIGTDNGTDDFPGLIDEVRIYDRELTAGEIAALYSSPLSAVYWQRLIGYMDAPKFNTTARSVSLSGGDSMKALADTKLASPASFWGDHVHLSSVETTKAFGVELYVEDDALDPAFEEDVITDWDGLNVTASSVDDAGYGSAYVMQIVKDTSTADGWEGNDAAATLVNGSTYEVTFGYHRTAGTGTLRCLVYPTMTLDQMGQLTGLVADVWTTAEFHFVSTTSGAARLRFYITDPGASTTFRIDSISIKEVTARKNTRYPMPLTCNGVYLVELDGVPLWYGSDNAGWLYDSANQVFYFADTVWVETGTNNLTVYYFTTQDIVDVLGDVLMDSGLYATRVAALAALSYVDPGVDIPKVWFETGTTALTATAKICERCDYRFWFDELDVPHFQPAPTHGDPVAWFSPHTFSDAGEGYDLGEVRNSIIVEGIERGAFSTAKDKVTSRLTGLANDGPFSVTKLERTYKTTNDLFQTQAVVDAAAAALLAEFKDPKLYADLRVPDNPIPLERGDTVEWDIDLRVAAGDGSDEGLKNTVQGIIRDISFSGDGFNYKCEMESGAMNIANYAAGPVTVTAEHCKNWALTNSGAAGDVHFDLPAATVGMRITFYVLAAQTLTVDPNGTDRIAVLTGTAGDYLQSDNVIGSYIILVCFAAGFWHKVDFIGTWTEE